MAQKDTKTLTITDPQCTRFWISTEDLSKFAIKCFDFMKGGEIFVPKLPSINITDLAKVIAPNAKPPVAKLMDINKFLYHEEKKLREAKKGSRKGEIKDIQLSLFIGQADLERFIKRGKEFLDEGNQLRINVFLRGREMAKISLAMQRVKDYMKSLGDLNVSKEPKLEGRVIRAVVSRKK